MRSILMPLVLLGLAAPLKAGSSGFDFDPLNFDVKSVVAAAKQEAKKDGAKVQSVRAAYRAERDCADFLFKPEGPLVSEAVWLRSTEYREECHWTGDPRNGGVRVCREVPGWTHREKVQVEVRGRQKLNPWEREVFTVCLEGRWLSIHGTEVGHKYKSEERGGYFTLTAGDRVKMNPDRHGIKLDAPRNTGTHLAADFRDVWASYYAGESVEIKYSLKRDVPNWFDATILSGEAKFAAGESYTVDFGKAEATILEALKPGKSYYVEYSFRRIGSVSKDIWMKAGESGRAEYKPSANLSLAEL